MRLWNPYGNTANPYPMYDRLRQHAPVYRSQSGDIIVTGYQEVKDILLKPELYRVGNRYEWLKKEVGYLINKDEDLSAIIKAMNSFLVQLNPPDHTIQRKLIIDAWSDKDVDRLIADNIAQLLGRINDQFDLVEDYASPLPVMTISKILGFPVEDYRHLKLLFADLSLSLDMYTSFKKLVLINTAAKKLMQYFDEYISYREKNLSEDLTSKIIKLARTRNIQLNKDQLISICLFLFMAGEETTINLIGTGTFHLLNNPEALASLKVNDTLWDNACEEVLRYESPVSLLGRIANVDTNIGNIKVKKEDTLTLCIGAANRDPDAFENPGLFQLQRKGKAHLAFGVGSHVCLGAWLVRRQWKLAVRGLVGRFSNLKMAGKPVWNTMLSIRGLNALPLST